MLSDHELMRVQEVSSKLTRPVKLLLFGTGSQDPLERQIFDVARQVSGVSMNRIIMEETSEPVMIGKPSLTVTDGNVGRIHYMAMPEGSQLLPFLDLISWYGTGEMPVDLGVRTHLDKLGLPAGIMVLMSSSCPHCPQTVRSALVQAVLSDLVTVTIVDALMLSDLAQQFNCKSTPTTILNGEMTIVGSIGAEDLAKKLVDSSQEGSVTAVVESMVNSGRAEDAARLVCRRGQPLALVEVFRKKEFSTRIGALVAMESALDLNKEIFDPVLQELCDLLFTDDVGLKGDTAELLGKIGNSGAIPYLKKALIDDDEDVREAVEEALETLEANLKNE